MIKRIVLIFILFVFIYRLYQRYIAPLFRMSAAAHNRINDIKKQVDDMQQNQYKKPPKKQMDGEYIEYEEVK